MNNVKAQKILGVSEGASREQIRAAYVAKAKAHHPDAGGSADKMNEINAAYEYLKDPVRIAMESIKAKRQQADTSFQNAQQQPNPVRQRYKIVFGWVACIAVISIFIAIQLLVRRDEANEELGRTSKEAPSVTSIEQLGQVYRDCTARFEQVGVSLANVNLRLQSQSSAYEVNRDNVIAEQSSLLAEFDYLQKECNERKAAYDSALEELVQ
jgi:curved DNA-binding protein CbpA